MTDLLLPRRARGRPSLSPRVDYLREDKNRDQGFDEEKRRAGRGLVRSCASSPYWYDPSQFHELILAHGAQPLRALVAHLDGCSGGKAGEIVAAAKLDRKACADVTRQQATALLAAARKHARPVSPERLGCVGREVIANSCYAIERDHVLIGSDHPQQAEISFVVEAWAEKVSTAGNQIRAILARSRDDAADPRWQGRSPLINHDCPAASAASSKKAVDRRFWTANALNPLDHRHEIVTHNDPMRRIANFDAWRWPAVTGRRGRDYFFNTPPGPGLCCFWNAMSMRHTPYSLVTPAPPAYALFRFDSGGTPRIKLLPVGNAAAATPTGSTRCEHSQRGKTPSHCNARVIKIRRLGFNGRAFFQT